VRERIGTNKTPQKKTGISAARNKDKREFVKNKKKK